jgi:hypothetical protein
MRFGSFITACSLVATLCAQSRAATVYTDRGLFQAQLGSSLTDDYQNPKYINQLTNVQMNAVLNQTEYFPTEFSNVNVFTFDSSTGNQGYCAGCNGTFIADFQHTSYGSLLGVFGVGLDILSNSSPIPGDGATLDALVQFSDGTTQDFGLQKNSLTDSPTFFGITDARGIETINFGINGQPSNEVTFIVDNLTIGTANLTPEPSSLLLFAFGLTGLGALLKRTRSFTR